MFKLTSKILKGLQSIFGTFGSFGITVFYMVILGLLIGYFVNIYKLVTLAMHQDIEWTVMIVLRIVGVVLGLLGGILGWL